MGVDGSEGGNGVVIGRVERVAVVEGFVVGCVTAVKGGFVDVGRVEDWG